MIFSDTQFAKPNIDLTIARCKAEVWWDLGFYKHHYMSEDLNVSCKCYVVKWGDTPVAFVALAAQMSRGIKNSFRFSRIVVLPDYQGLGIVSRVMNFFGGIVKAHSSESRLFIKTIHTRVGAFLNRSPNWKPTHFNGVKRDFSNGKNVYKSAKERASFCFEYVGEKINGLNFLLLDKELSIEVNNGQSFFPFFKL